MLDVMGRRSKCSATFSASPLSSRGAEAHKSRLHRPKAPASLRDPTCTPFQGQLTTARSPGRRQARTGASEPPQDVRSDQQTASGAPRLAAEANPGARLGHQYAVAVEFSWDSAKLRAPLAASTGGSQITLDP